MNKTNLERFMGAYIPVTESGCWIWLKSCHHTGYGQFHWDNRVRMAHIFSYLTFKGPIPEGLHLDHLCRVRCCVNPDHLEAVTCRENLRRASVLITHCPQGHPYDHINTYICLRGVRNCKACSNDRQRRNWRVWRARRKARAKVAVEMI